MRFVDASAVATAYLDQPDRERMRSMLDEGGIVVSRLTEVETTSAFARLVHDAVLTAERRDETVLKFLADLALWDTVELTGEVVAVARSLLTRHRLRAGDAVQLASALLVQARARQPLAAFVTYDRRLRDAAQVERLPIFPE